MYLDNVHMIENVMMDIKVGINIDAVSVFLARKESQVLSKLEN